jgi:hypothetical protein
VLQQNKHQEEEKKKEREKRQAQIPRKVLEQAKVPWKRGAVLLLYKQKYHGIDKWQQGCVGQQAVIASKSTTELMSGNKGV